MRSIRLIIAALSSIALAAPSQTIDERAINSWSAPLARFYQAVDQTIQEARKSPDYPKPPGCDMSKATLPVAPTPLPSPDADTYLRHVAIGRGIQNYTCADSSPSSTPVPIGAVASLYNASCTTCNYPTLSTMMTNLVINYPLPSNPNDNFQPTNILLSGRHFFRDNKTPIFDLDLTPKNQYGYVVAKKDSSSAPPSDAPKGPKGEDALAWLLLNTVDGTTSGIKHVYRVHTVGGSPPKTCEGRKAGVFTVEYSAQYWVFAQNES